MQTIILGIHVSFRGSTLQETNISHQTLKGKSLTHKCRLVGDMLVLWRIKAILDSQTPKNLDKSLFNEQTGITDATLMYTLSLCQHPTCQKVELTTVGDTTYASFSAADKSLIMGYLTIPNAKILYSTFRLLT